MRGRMGGGGGGGGGGGCLAGKWKGEGEGAGLALIEKADYFRCGAMQVKGTIRNRPSQLLHENSCSHFL